LRKDAVSAILAEVSRAGSGGITTMELEAAAKIERHTLVKYLSVMESDGILSMKSVGRGKIWSVNREPFRKISKTPQKELSFAEKFVVDLVSSLPVGVIVVDRDYNVQFANKNAEECFGEIAGEKFYSGVLGLKSSLPLKKVNEVVEGRSELAEMKALSPKNKVLRIKAAGMKNPGGESSTILIIEDITEAESSERQLKKAFEKLKQMDELKSNVLKDTARALKQPISIITMSTDTLAEEMGKERPDKERLKKYFEIFNRNSKMFQEQIESILQLSKIEAGEKEADESANVAEIFKEQAREFSAAAARKGLKFNASAGKVPEMSASSGLLASMVRNLLSNAVKFTERGFIDAKCFASGGKIFIAVKDSGIGISPENSGKIFQPFSKLEKSTEGIGVGLSICREIAEMYGGKISFISELGKGSTFTVELPSGKR